MSLLDKIIAIETKFAWSFFGFIVAIIFGAITFYTLLHDKKPDILFEITNESNVFDVHRPVEGLNITFQNDDIQEENLNLKLTTIKIMNKGEADVLQGHYDNNTMWGLSVLNATAIEVRLQTSNDEYLEKNIRPVLINGSTIQFTKVIFEEDRYFTLEILSLHDKNTSPEFIPIGKIAGINKIKTIKTWSDKHEDTFLKRLFQGGLSTNIYRFILFGFVFFVGFILTIGIILKVDEFSSNLKKEKRQKSIVTVLYTLRPMPDEQKFLISEVYTQEGLNGLIRVKDILSNPSEDDLIHFKYLIRKRFASKLKYIKHNDIEISKHTYKPGRHRENIFSAGLIELGEKDNLEINEDFITSLAEVILKLETESKK